MGKKGLPTTDPSTVHGFIKLKDAAVLVDVQPQTLRTWIATGRLRGHKLHGQWRVVPREVLALVRPVAFEHSDGAA